MPKAILFDLDNTLVTFWSFKVAAVQAAARAMVEAGLPLSGAEAQARLLTAYQNHNVEFRGAFSEMLDDFALPSRLHEQYLEAAIAAHREAKSSTLHPYPQVSELLDALRSKTRLALLTDAPLEKALSRLSFSGLAGRFHAVGAFEGGSKKPFPEPFLRICQAVGVAPSEALMVGDHPGKDIAGANRLGMPSCLARYGQVFGGEGVADLVIDSPIELLTVLPFAQNGRPPGPLFI